MIPRLVLVAACLPALSSAGPGSLSAQASPAPITFSSGSWQLTLGGYLKLDLIHDFDPIGSPDSFDPRAIPVDGSEGTNTRVHARETRLSLGIDGPVEGRDLQLFLEGDFYGTGNAFRLRHAYAQSGVLLAGQTWTTVMNADNISPTIDFETPLAAPLVRQGLLRVTTGLSKRSDLAFAIEESDPEILIPPGVQGTTEKPWPDVTTRFRFTDRRGHVQLSGFVGRSRFRAATGAASDVTIGGVLASTRLSLFHRDTTYAQVAYGPGVGRYRGAALVLTSVPALFLSGISFPWENQATWVQVIALALPTTFGIRGFVQIGEMGATLAEAWRSWGAHWLQAMVYGLAAAYLMGRRRLRGEQ